MFDSNTWNHLTVCKQMSSGLMKIYLQTNRFWCAGYILLLRMQSAFLSLDERVMFLFSSSSSQNLILIFYFVSYYLAARLCRWCIFQTQLKSLNLKEEFFFYVEANVLAFDIIVSEFELQSRYDVHFQIITLGKRIPQVMGYSSLFFY